MVAVAERDWHAIEKLYVFGQVVRVREDGSADRDFPSIRSVAERFGVSRSVVGDRAFRDDWVGRRLKFRAELRKATWEKLMADEVARSARPPRVV